MKALEHQLSTHASDDRRVVQLETIPGVGRISAQTLLAAVDTIQRFPSAKCLVAYSGLAPSVRASGGQVRYGAITKQGRSEIRAVWVQAAFAAGGESASRLAPAGVVAARGAPARQENRRRGLGSKALGDRLSHVAGSDRLSAAPTWGGGLKGGVLSEMAPRLRRKPPTMERGVGIPPAAGDLVSRA